ncbi:hypothetical protein DL98DRAFT_654203 [Cadophora sp. DSE1049]|nr:hypothetical protein DL98DRAFT_654203 [Cadophora sp. DSE1049]
MSSGLCVSDNGLIYRGSCTDHTWKHPSCSTYCVDSEGKNAGKQDDFVFLKPCSSSTGSLIWVCGFENNCSNSSLTFPLLVGGTRQSNIPGKVPATSSSTISHSSSSSQSPTPASASASPSSDPDTVNGDECSSRETAIGAGIGVPLGVLLLMALLWAVWERRKRSLTQRTTEEAWFGDGMVKYESPPPVEAPDTARMSELPPKTQAHVTHPELA